jgi:NAD(P)-dependent dehydrogenase (short-subunit alcohol dehydrogenase family)
LVLLGQKAELIFNIIYKNTMSKVIFITGTSRGFGRIWAEAFLKRGDKVVATARNIDSLKDLTAEYGDSILPLELDVTDRAAGFEAVAKAQRHFGRIDVLINNAGYGLFGAIEETTENEARAQMEPNFFGLLWMSQAVLPIMRAQKSGHIIQISSILGLMTLPVLGLYNASKFAVEGLSETLATEVAPFGIKVTMLEPNGFSTDWSGASAIKTESLEIYEPLKQAFAATADPSTFGNPNATAVSILKIVDSKNPPLRLLLGEVAHPLVKQAYEEKLALWNHWETATTDHA